MDSSPISFTHRLCCHASSKLRRSLKAPCVYNEGAISRLQKERILLSIAVDRQDAYCIALDSKVLSSLGASESQIDSLLSDHRNADLSANDLACLQFCLKLARHAPSVSSEDIETSAGMRIRRRGDIRSRGRDSFGSLPLHAIRGFGSGARFRMADAPCDENCFAA